MGTRTLHLRILLPALLTCLMAVPALGSTWQPIGPYGGSVLDVAEDLSHDGVRYAAIINMAIYRAVEHGLVIEGLRRP